MTQEHTKHTTIDVLEKHGIPVVELKDDSHPRYLDHKEKIIKLHQDGAISQTQISAMTALAPHLVDLSKSVAETAVKSQTAVIDAHKKSTSEALSIQGRIIEKTKSEETLIRVSDNITSMNKDNNETYKKLNKSNNGLFEKIGIGIAGALVGGVVGFFLRNK